MTDILNAPLHEEPDSGPRRAPEEGTALCLSGGGYRAMLFHLGSLWRLNEFGYLPKLQRVSSVSGGSIVAGYLGLKWEELSFNDRGVAANFESLIVKGIRGLVGKTIDQNSILGGVFWAGSVADYIQARYAEYLFGEATLQDLPDSPRFVINATNVQSGAQWRFSKAYMRDYRVGEVKEPKEKLALAVAASSAFPPVLSPLVMELDPDDFTPDSGQDLQYEPYTSEVVLTDGGVYDNLGLQTAWGRYRTILVSDGGAQMEPEEEPKKDWARHSYRIFNVVDNQVRNLRKRQLLESYRRAEQSADPNDTTWRRGAYWGIRTDIEKYGLPDALHAPRERTCELAAVPTRLKRVPISLQRRLINWGYAVCDAAMRSHCEQDLPAPAGFPYEGGV